MTIEMWVGLGAAVIVVGAIVVAALGRRRTVPVPAPVAPPAVDDELDDGMLGPLALRPVTDDPYDTPLPQAAPRLPPGRVDDEADDPTGPTERTLREHHRSESGDLRILFSTSMPPTDKEPPPRG